MNAGEDRGDGEKAKSNKINIFDSKIKQDSLAAIGYTDKKALVKRQNTMETRSHSSLAPSEALEPLLQKPKAVEYLNISKEGKESCKDFISFSRKILMTQIAINDKAAEN